MGLYSSKAKSQPSSVAANPNNPVDVNRYNYLEDKQIAINRRRRQWLWSRGLVNPNVIPVTGPNIPH
jgi:hypothetical protein